MSSWFRCPRAQRTIGAQAGRGHRCVSAKRKDSTGGTALNESVAHGGRGGTFVRIHFVDPLPLHFRVSQSEPRTYTFTPALAASPRSPPALCRRSQHNKKQASVPTSALPASSGRDSTETKRRQ